MKRSRNTLAKRIAKQTGISKKLDVVFGKDDPSYWARHIDTLASVQKVIYFALPPEKQKRWITPDPGPITIEKWAAIGHLVAMQMVERDYKFFGRLAAMLQYPNKDIKVVNAVDQLAQLSAVDWVSDKLYFDVLAFCYVRKCGTAQKPADDVQLLEHLIKKGHKLSLTYDKQVPSKLRNTCQRIGVILSSRRSFAHV